MTQGEVRTPLRLTASDRLDRRGVMAALDASQCLVWFDAFGRVVDANLNIQALLGYSGDEMGRLLYPDLVGGQGHAAYMDRHWSRIRDGALKSEERALLTRNGAEIWSSLTYAAIRTEDGRTRRILCIAIDLAPWSWRDEGPARAR